jgi:hypothetical protein
MVRLFVQHLVIILVLHVWLINPLNVHLVFLVTITYQITKLAKYQLVLQMTLIMLVNIAQLGLYFLMEHAHFVQLIIARDAILQHQANVLVVPLVFI